MFPTRKPLTIIAVAFCVVSACDAADMPAPDLTSVIAELEAIKDNQTSARQKTLSVAIAQVEEFAKNPASAVRAYGDAKRIVEFDGKPNAGPKFADWKKDKSDLLGSRGLQIAAPLHLQYLAISLRQSGDPDTDTRVKESLDYVAKLGESSASHGQDLNAFGETKDLMNKPLQEGVFAQAAQIGGVLTNLKDWELVPGNLDGILEKNVRRVLRQKKDPRAIDTWDLQIDLEQKIANESDNEIALANFTNSRRPQLLWRKANEYVALGQPVRGLSLMVELIRANPNHPDMERWLEAATNTAKSQQKAP
ncbi:MAG: hypothetical protein ACOVMP_07520 [Chthoniobacterales bacterium]